MKKYLIIILTLLSACSVLRKPETTVTANQNINNMTLNNPDTKAAESQSNSYVPLQNFKGDTLGYVQQNFIDKKQKYIGKDLNALLNDVEIPIKSFLYGDSEINNNISPDVILQFYTSRQSSLRLDRPDKPVNIIITWSSPLPIISAIDLWHQHSGAWTEAERLYFGKQIIGDIQTTKWGK